MTELIRLTRGLWRPTNAVDDLIGRVAALLSVYPPDTVVCGVTAAILHGLWLPSSVDTAIELIIHPSVPTPSARAASYRGPVRARRQRLLPDETCLLEGIPITTEGRTWLDLAAVLAPADLVAAGDSALRGTADLAELDMLVRRAWHRRGVIKARHVLPYLNPRSRSRPESHLRFALVAGGLPAPGVNVPIFNDLGEWLAEPDLSYDDVKLALEYNGADHAETSRMRKDITRDVGVSFGRWRTQVFGPIEVFGHPDQAVSLVRQLRRERAR